MPGRAGGSRLRGGILTMKGRDITEQIRQAGYEVALSEDWQRVRCTGPEPLTEACKDLLKANKHEVLFWLVANAFKDHLNGRILETYDTTGMVATDYPPSNAALREQWLASAEEILAQRDGKGRLDATSSEIDTCIIGLRSFMQPDALAMCARLKDSIPEAKKCSNRLKAQTRRRIANKDREWKRNH